MKTSSFQRRAPRRRSLLVAVPLLAAGAAACVPPPSAPATSLKLASSPTESVIGNGDSFQSALSDDGTKVAFASDASNLVAGDTNGLVDVFVKDLASGTLTLVSVGADGGSSDPSISDDGTKVAFASDATNLVAGDTNGVSDVFVADLVNDTVVSLSAAGDDFSGAPVISGDGTTVAFQTYATNLVAGDANATADIVTAPAAGGSVTPVSATLPNDYSAKPSISDDGTKVVFQTYATNLLPGDVNGEADIVLASAGSVAAVTPVSPAGFSDNPAVSGDGSVVAFETFATNLVAGDVNGVSDIVVVDVSTPAAPVVLRSLGGNDQSSAPVLSDDGSRVAFVSFASNLVSGDNNGQGEVFVAPTTTGKVLRATGSRKGNGFSGEPAISGSGAVVSFTTAATNLVAGDGNAKGDVLVRDLTA